MREGERVNGKPSTKMWKEIVLKTKEQLEKNIELKLQYNNVAVGWFRQVCVQCTHIICFLFLWWFLCFSSIITIFLLVRTSGFYEIQHVTYSRQQLNQYQSKSPAHTPKHPNIKCRSH